MPTSKPSPRRAVTGADGRYRIPCDAPGASDNDVAGARTAPSGSEAGRNQQVTALCTVANWLLADDGERATLPRQAHQLPLHLAPWSLPAAW